jgi:hypothetical protein
MITLTINLHERADFTNDDGEMQVASQAALDRAVSALKYDGFSLVSAVVSNDIQVDANKMSENTTETPTVVINRVDEYDHATSWERRISFTYKGEEFKNVTLWLEEYEGYALSDLYGEQVGILGDLATDDDFLAELDDLSAGKQYEVYHIKRD